MALLTALSGAIPCQRHHCGDAARARGHVPHPCRHSQWRWGPWAVEFYVVDFLAMTLGSLHAHTQHLVGRGRGPAGGARGRGPRWGARQSSPVGYAGPQRRRSDHHPAFLPPSSAEEVRGPSWHCTAPAILAPLTVPVDRRRPRQPTPSPPRQRCYRPAAAGGYRRFPRPPAVVAMPAAPVRWRLSRWGAEGGWGRAAPPPVVRPCTDDHLHRRRFVFSPSCFFCRPFYPPPLSCPLLSPPIPPTITRPTCHSRPSPPSPRIPPSPLHAGSACAVASVSSVSAGAVINYKEVATPYGKPNPLANKKRRYPLWRLPPPYAPTCTSPTRRSTPIQPRLPTTERRRSPRRLNPSPRPIILQ